MPDPLQTPPAPASWTAAWRATPGPRTWAAHLWLFLKGAAMGTANIIPGVSGGTIALITRIYEPLLAAVASFDLSFLRALLGGRPRQALATAHVRFLTPVGLGIVASTMGVAGLMQYLLAEHEVETWAAFFGLILASIWIVAKEVRFWHGGAILCVLLGAAGAYAFVGLIPVQTPQTWWFVALCGAVAMCAMVLPGLSGSFLLVILGKYEYVIAAVHDPLAADHPWRLAVFLAGALAGVLAFTRLLHWCLHHLHDETMGLLMGLMIGAMRKIWPWKHVLETRWVGGREVIIREENVLPPAFTAEVALAAGLMVAGAGAVFLLEYLSREEDPAAAGDRDAPPGAA